VPAAGTVDRVGGVTRFSAISGHPTVTIPNGADAAAAQRAIDKAAERCLVSSSLETPVHVQATIRESSASVAA
jgi:organic hydroperoxide reductase OsmC/OhrA